MRWHWRARDWTAATPPTPLPTCCCSATGFCAALSGHHRAEDGSLFPELVRARPDLAPVVAKLTQDHNMIEHLIGELRKAVADSTDPEVAHRHLDGIEAVMETHFKYEEKQLGAVLDGMDADFDRTEIFGPIS